MTVKELIEHLKTFDQDLPVAFEFRSEFTALEQEQIYVAELTDNNGYLTRPYRHIENTKKVDYLCFPGN